MKHLYTYIYGWIHNIKLYWKWLKIVQLKRERNKSTTAGFMHPYLVACSLRIAHVMFFMCIRSALPKCAEMKQKQRIFEHQMFTMNADRARFYVLFLAYFLLTLSAFSTLLLLYTVYIAYEWGSKTQTTHMYVLHVLHISSSIVFRFEYKM